MTQLPSILLVDDDPTTNYLNHSLLTRMAVAERVLVATDGGAALTLLHQFCVPRTPDCPALILLDVNMPGLNGIQFLEAYQQLPLIREQGIVIVMLTTSLHPRDLAQVEQLGLVAEVMSKPLTAEKVTGILTAHFATARE